MKLNELFTEPQPLLEGKQLEVYDALLPFLLFEEDEGSPGDGETPDDVTPSPPPVQPPGGGGWYRPGPFRPGGMGMSGSHWFNELYASLKHLAVASNILKRLKVLGVSGSGAKRVQLAAKTAAKHVRLLLSNPGATAYRLPVWTFDTPPRQRIKVWNEAFAKEFQRELSKVNLNEYDNLS